MFPALRQLPTFKIAPKIFKNISSFLMILKASLRVSIWCLRSFKAVSNSIEKSQIFILKSNFFFYPNAMKNASAFSHSAFGSSDASCNKSENSSLGQFLHKLFKLSNESKFYLSPSTAKIISLASGNFDKTIKSFWLISPEKNVFFLFTSTLDTFEIDF